ncbi:MAG: hypothetical protein Q9174_004289 [Haloplaca sp. 1 TL-2023]
MSDQFADCIELTPNCPVDATIYGYAPNLGANVFFAVIFGICLIAQLYQNIKYRTWTYLVAMGFGCVGEVVGYAGRIIMHDNPWDETGFQMQICCLIIAPAFITAAVYLTLKHLVLTFGEEHSRIRARWYTWIFIGCDLFSLVLQGVGGGIAASADSDSTSDAGGRLMLAGIVWQVFTLIVFAALCTDYALRAHKNKHTRTAAASNLLRTFKFQAFIAGLVTAFTTISVRCIYRIAELAHGWSSEIMRNEDEFIVLEGVVIVIAAVCLTVFHPGYCFPPMCLNKQFTEKGVVDEKDPAETGV